MSASICTYLCLHVCLLVYLKNQSSQHFLYMLPMAMAHSSSDNKVISYILLILWMMSYFHTVGHIVAPMTGTVKVLGTYGINTIGAKSAVLDCLILFCVNSPGAFGTVFLPGSPQISDARLFTARPGLRLWKADSSGTVEATLMFRDQLTQSSDSATLLHDLTLENSPSTRNEDRQFGQLLLYGVSCLVTYHGTCLYVLDYVQNAVVCYHGNVGPIRDVAVCNDEVYILRSFIYRPLIRLSQQPLYDNISTMKGMIISHLKGFGILYGVQFLCSD